MTSQTFKHRSQRQTVSEHSSHKFLVKNLPENKFRTTTGGINIRTGGVKLNGGFKEESIVDNGGCVCVQYIIIIF